jgi:carboxymethylenebutenolidase
MPQYEGMLAETVQFKGHKGDTISGYMARPLGAGPYPGVVVIPEIFGLVTHQKEVARKIAHEGYVAVAIDLWDREARHNPSASVDDVAAQVRAAGGVPDDRCIGDVEGLAALLRSLPYCNGKVGVIGFCSGGRQVYLVACNIPTLNAAVDCYGGRVVATPDQLNPGQPKAPIDMTAGLKCPLLGLFGKEDQNPSPEHVTRMDAELKRLNKTHEFHSYDGAGHAFFADYRPSYRQAAAVDGWQKVFAWYGKHLA